MVNHILRFILTTLIRSRERRIDKPFNPEASLKLDQLQEKLDQLGETLDHVTQKQKVNHYESL